MKEAWSKQEAVDFDVESNSSDLERRQEDEHLESCLRVIQQNIDKYMQEFKDLSEETKELYDNYRSSNPELHNDLVIGLDMRSHVERTLKKNLLALKKPYFGQIDYKEDGDKVSYRLYLGKNGVRKNITENMIVDWRAPISSVYYESDIGKSSYATPFGDRIEIELFLKVPKSESDARTFICLFPNLNFCDL